jgi:hypothetical protein
MTTAQPESAPESAPAAAPVIPSKPARKVAAWDLILTIVLLLLVLLAGGIAGAAGIFLVFLTDSCGSGANCVEPQLDNGYFIATVGVWIPAVLAVIASIIVLVLKRRAFWIPIVGIVLIVATWAVGYTVLTGAIVPA